MRSTEWLPASRLVLGFVPHPARVAPRAAVSHLGRNHDYALRLKDGGRIILIQKSSPEGPFVRADFTSEDELAEFLVGDALKSGSVLETRLDLHYLVSIDDRLIRLHDPTTQQLQNRKCYNKVPEDTARKLADPHH